MSSFVTIIRKHGIFGFREPIEFLLIGITGLLNVALWAATGLLVQSHGLQAPIHYTIYFGIDLTAAADRLYILPGVGTAVWISHWIAARAVSHTAWRQTWLVVALTFQVLLACILAALTYLSFQS